MMQQQQQLEQEKLSISQILRIHGKQYRQIQSRYSDGNNGRCAIGVIMSYFGWDGRVYFAYYSTVNQQCMTQDERCFVKQ
jgi:hypothetical protein